MINDDAARVCSDACVCRAVIHDAAGVAGTVPRLAGALVCRPARPKRAVLLS
ncbi:hypothetical protein HMPREF1978_01412 [Actinomyces graevenitzii F0530]|uniref:Uncharacterized protein n=1 Tax=Actinomyces graevenitzii F0530 TaxID=1321817 RepID=U1PXQ8_9ACTO|nr:hypothetical protein HMPREF1978_01412 [Actinomyces graevenitzii F0530]